MAESECECGCHERVDELEWRIEYLESWEDDESFESSDGMVFYYQFTSQLPSMYPFGWNNVKKANNQQLVFETDDIKVLNDMINIYEEYDEISQEYSIDDDGEEYTFQMSNH